MTEAKAELAMLTRLTRLARDGKQLGLSRSTCERAILSQMRPALRMADRMTGERPTADRVREIECAVRAAVVIAYRTPDHMPRS